MSECITHHICDCLKSMMGHTADERDELQAEVRRLEAISPRIPGKITPHWLTVAYERVCAGEPEADVLEDYGYIAVGRITT